MVVDNLDTKLEGPALAIPTLGDVIDQLKEVAEVDDIGADTPLVELEDIDSLDLMEWAYVLQETYDLEVDETVLEEFDESSTLRQIYEQVIAGAVATTEAQG